MEKEYSITKLTRKEYWHIFKMLDFEAFAKEESIESTMKLDDSDAKKQLLEMYEEDLNLLISLLIKLCLDILLFQENMIETKI